MFPSQSPLLFGKSDFAAGKAKIIKNMVFLSSAQMKCKNSGKLPVGHINEYPLQRKWKSGDCNQIMLLHCRSAHKDELEAIEAQKEKSTQKAASAACSKKAQSFHIMQPSKMN